MTTTTLIKRPYNTEEIVNNFILRKEEQLTGEDFAKWAGWADTDGTLVKNKNNKLLFSLKLKDKSPVELFSHVFESSLIYQEFKTRPPKRDREKYPHMRNKIYTAKVYKSEIWASDKTKWIVEKIYPYLLKPEKKEYAIEILGYTPKSKNLSDWTRAELINYIATAFEGDGNFHLPKQNKGKSLLLNFYSSDSEYISLVKYVLEEKLNLPLFNLYQKKEYDSLEGKKHMYNIWKCFSQKNTPGYNDFFKEIIEAMTMDRKRQIVIDYLKINEVE